MSELDGADQAPLDGIDLSNAIWCSRSLRCPKGRTLGVLINDQEHFFRVAGSLPGADHYLVLDIEAAQQVLHRQGFLDRIEVRVPTTAGVDGWQTILRRALPPAAEIQPTGSGTESNRRMLAAFGWNLRILSYIALVVGAFLIYNTIAVSVVRRRAEIGIVRALGGTRALVTSLFLLEAVLFGLLGAAIGIPAGRVLAESTVRLLGMTVQALYVASTPGAIALTPAVWFEALAMGIGISVVAALAPAIEAARVSPTKAMARGQREYRARIRSLPNLLAAAACSMLALWASAQQPLGGKPVFGYLACFLLVGVAALLTPGLITFTTPLLSNVGRRMFGVEALLAARSVHASLLRSTILVSALGTAIAMMVSVGIMVGSFRETVDSWMSDQLRADFYLRPAAAVGAGRFPTLSADIAPRLAGLASVAAVDQFRVYEVRYDGLPALFGGGDISVVRQYGSTTFLHGDRNEIFGEMISNSAAIVSEPFANKHGVREGQTIHLKLAGRNVALHVAGIYHDYSNESGYVVVDRATLMRFLPDPAPSNIAVYLKPGVSLEQGRAEIEHSVADREIVVAANRTLREEGLRTFDRTFSVTWALEAVAIIVAVLGIAGALLAMVMDRRREMALLRFLGAAPQQIRRLILWEAAILGLLSILVGLGLGGLLSLLLIYVINVQSFGWTIEFHWPAALLLFALGGVYLATILAGLWPARAALKLNPIESIHEE
jgi:putative ABC transport system permease protein